MMQVSLRRATAADAPAIAQVRIDSWRATYRGMIPDAYLDGMKLEESVALWTKVLGAGSDKICVFVAESAGEVIGFASGMLLSEPKFGLDAELSSIYLKQDCQRSGLGRRLVQEVAQVCGERGASGLLVWVIAGNAGARKFYEALGAEQMIEQEFSWDGLDMVEVGYGWKDISTLAPAVHRQLH